MKRRNFLSAASAFMVAAAFTGELGANPRAAEAQRAVADMRAAGELGANPRAAEAEEKKNPMLPHINLDRLGPKGEITVGFLLTLNPRPCAHFTEEQKQSKSTKEEDVLHIYRHLLLHGNKAEDIREACREAQKQWQEREQKKENNAAPAPANN